MKYMVTIRSKDVVVSYCGGTAFKAAMEARHAYEQRVSGKKKMVTAIILVMDQVEIFRAHGSCLNQAWRVFRDQRSYAEKEAKNEA
jgi:translation initiation factor IF-1